MWPCHELLLRRNASSVPSVGGTSWITSSRLVPERNNRVKFLLKGLAKLGASHLLDQLRKCWAVGYLAQRETAGTRNFGIIVVDRAARVGLYKFRNDQKLEWLAGKRRRPEFLQIEHRKHRRTLHEHTGISS